MKRCTILLLLVGFLLISIIPVSAQSPGDPDGDNIFYNKDQCPYAAGPASNNGCPLTQPSQPQPPPLHPPGDSDGDGTLDEKDQCPLDGGPDWNNGCPTDLTAPPQSQPQIILPTMPTSGPCVIATVGQARVNLRAMPKTTSAIIGVLNPATLYPAFAAFTDTNGGIWYLVKTGWSAGHVLRTGGSCDTLPRFDFGDVLLNFADGPGEGIILNFQPVPDGKPFVTLRPFAGPAGEQVSLNFTKVEDSFPTAGFSFLLLPFPVTGDSNNEPGSSPKAPGSDVFDDGFLRAHMGDGSVFVMMPPAPQDGENPLYGILIGLSQPEVDPNHILIGLSQPTITEDIASPDGILIGMLLPAVQKGGTNLTGILIGLLLPAVQKGETNLVGFRSENSGGGGNNTSFPPSIQKIRDMGLNFLVPAAGAPTRQLFTIGWGVEIEGIVMPTE